MGLTVNDLMHRLPEMLDQSQSQYKILNPEVTRYETTLQSFKKYPVMKAKLINRVERMLKKL